jgi:hypothetical protein
VTDALYWDAHEELMVKLEREPEYEEVQDYLNSKFKEKDNERHKLISRKH